MEKPVCKIEGCDKPFRAFGLCVSHYGKQRRIQDFTPAITESDKEEYWQWVKKELNLGG
jgi:hypothetical protein